jgi:hypothetical protein
MGDCYGVIWQPSGTQEYDIGDLLQLICATPSIGL